MCNTSLIHIHKIDDPFFFLSFYSRFPVARFVLLSGLLGIFVYPVVRTFQTFVVSAGDRFNFLLRKFSSFNLVLRKLTQVAYTGHV